MLENFKKVSISALALVMVAGVGQPLLANAEATSDNTVTTEKGESVSIGAPLLKSKARSIAPSLEFSSEKSGNTIVQTITIDSSTPDSSIVIPFELNSGDYIALAEDSQGNTDGAATIYDASEDSLALIFSPVSDDDSQLKITSAEVIDGDTLKLNLDTTNQTTATNLAVTFAATAYSDYFSSGIWEPRDGTHETLSLMHKPYLFSGTTNDRAMKVGDSWNKIVDKHSGSVMWHNTGGMQDQYNCHYNTVGAGKNPWNLEPDRQDLSYVDTVANKCNPPY